MKKAQRKILFIASFIFIQCIWCLPLFAKVDPASLLATSKSAGFIENKGQVIDQYRKSNSAVLYLLNGNGLNVHLRKTGFSYDIFTTQRKTKALLGMAELIQKLPGKEIEPEEVTYHFHRIDITLLGANPSPQIIAEGKSSDYTNYYNVDHASDGILEVHQYQKITYKAIYPGIDIEYLLNEKGFKYNFVVHAGAQLSDIKLQYKGAPFKTNGQELIFNTNRGEFKESIPASWLIKNGLNQTVQVDYTLLDKETIGFKTQAQIASFDLVVDPNPTRLWGTYYGGGNVEEGKALCSDVSGNVYLTGNTQSTNNIASSGSHQSTIGGIVNAFLIKFNTSGVSQWSTYYGGNDNSRGESICSDASGNVYLAGSTGSTNNIATTASHQASSGGNYDAFFVKFNTNGVRQWGTYYGGISYDFGYSLCIDVTGNIYLSGQTNSSNNISTTGSHQTNLAGNNDAFLVKFNTNGSRLWATYYGGSDRESAYGSSICTDANGNIYLASSTISVDNISTSGTYQTGNGGGEDGFLVKFNTNGVRQWGTFYGGNSLDVARNICTDASGNIYLAGVTNGMSNISSAGTHQVIYGGGVDAYLVKFNTNGVRQWATYYGGNDYEDVFSVYCEANGNIYLAGNTGSDNNIATTSGYQLTNAGGRDAFLVKFNTNGVRQWGTFYGGIGSDYGYAVGKDVSGSIYLAGNSLGSNSLSTSGSHQTVNGGSDDAFLIKFQECIPTGTLGTIGTINNPATTYCQNSTYTFSLSSSTVNAAGYWWTLPLGWVIVSGQNTTTIIVNANTSGTISVKAYNSCGDTTSAATRSISVISFGTIGNISGSSDVCVGNAVIYSVPTISGAASYIWTLPSGLTGSSTTNNINATVGSTIGSGNMSVRGVNGICSSAVAQLPIAIYAQVSQPGAVTGASSFCANSQQNFGVSTVANASAYLWTLPSGWSFNGANNTNNISTTVGNNAGNFILSVQATNPGCTSTVRTQSITVNASPQISGSITGNVNTCEGATQTYSVSATNASSYSWTFPSGWSGSSSSNSIGLTFNGVADTLRVVAIGSSGCSSVQTKRFINVQAKPVQPIVSGLTQGCSSQYETFRVNKVLNALSYTWTAPNGWDMSPSNGISTDTSILIRPTSGVGGNISVKATSTNGCVGAERILNISSISTSIPSTPLAITGDNAFCVGVSKTYSIAAVSGATGYTWTVPIGWNISSGQNTTSINVIPNSNTGTMQVQSIQGGCRSSFSSLSIFNSYTQASKPQSITPSSQPACELSSITLSSNTLIGASSYVWQLPSDWSFIGNSTLQTIQVKVGSSNGNVTVRGKNEGCESDSSLSLGMTVSRLPQFLGGIAGEKYIKANTSRNYSIAASNANSYVWNIPSDWLLLGGENTNSIMVLTGSQNATLGVKAINNCGFSQSSLNVITGVSATLIEQDDFKSLKIFPIPANEKIFIDYELQKQIEIQFELFGLNGQTLFSGKLSAAKGLATIETNDLATGLYLLRFINQGREITSKKIQIIR